MDRTLDVRTPESIAFSFELAGLGSRFLAVALDLAIQIALFVLIFWGLTLLASHSSVAAHAKSLPASNRFWANVGIAIVVAIVFSIFFGYFIAFEALWNGQTPGKRALGLRVVRDGGYPVDFTASLVRNLIRVGELGLGFYAISALVAILSPENKRVGDVAAGTIVVRDSRMAQPDELLRSIVTEPQYSATAYLTGEERALVKRFLDRRDVLDANRRAALASQIASRVRTRVPVDLQRLDDEALLERL